MMFQQCKLQYRVETLQNLCYYGGTGGDTVHGDIIQAGMPMEIHYSTKRSTERFPALHTHEFYELYLFLKGEATYIVEDYAHVMSPGDLLIVPPGKFHRAAFDDLHKPYERLLVYVSMDTLQRIQVPGFSAAERIQAMASARAYCRPLPPEDVEAWLRLYRDASTQRPAQLLSAMCQLGMLIARLCDQDQTAEEVLPATGVIGPIIAYINDHYREELTLELLSQQFYMTQTHLSHLFRRYARLSVHQYITAKRMMLARTLLDQGATPQEASAQCGYQDYSSFYRAFVKAEGQSPRQYRDNIL